jgi:2-oxoisovalerate ferredoxin oxidoreductase alpha subunit
MTQQVMSGNTAAAWGARLARAQVVAAYPITPQTTIIEKIAEFIAKGDLDAQYLAVESEHSAMQACIAAAAMGARTYTATSSQGLLLMHELLHWAAGARAPIVMGVANRAVAPPWSVSADHTDTIAQRDTGWVQFYAESNQEVLDTTLQAYRLAEDPEVDLPVMVGEDAFFLTHTVEPVDVPSPAEVDGFLPPRFREHALQFGKMNRLGSYMPPDTYMEFRARIARAMERAARLYPVVEQEYADAVGRHHGGPVARYRTQDADAVLVTMGTAASTARTVVDKLRDEGKRVGLAKLRMFRPFPTESFRALAAETDRIGVLDRSFTFGAGGAAATEVAASLYHAPVRPLLRGFVAGLGGRDITPSGVEQMFASLLAGKGDDVEWVDLKADTGGATVG